MSTQDHPSPYGTGTNGGYSAGFPPGFPADTGEQTRLGHPSSTLDPIPREEPLPRDEPDRSEELDLAARQEERFGGVNWGAGFFGWLVAVAMAVLITGLLGAALTAADVAVEVVPNDMDDIQGTVGLAAAAVLVGVLMVAYYTGGYVAGRMSRFVGGKQGLGVWMTGLVSTLVTIAVGLLADSRYNVLGEVNLATIPIPTEAVGVEGAVTAAAALLGTLLAAVLGGKVGCRYHRKVDAFGYQPGHTG